MGFFVLFSSNCICSDISRMGPTNTIHIVNQTEETVKVVLVDPNNSNTTKILEEGQVCCIPTAKGSVILIAFKIFDQDAAPSNTVSSDTIGRSMGTLSHDERCIAR